MHGMHERMHGSWPPAAERPEVAPPADTSHTPPAPSPTGSPTPPPPAS
jgi:hypothetical protein